jgi:hypothetical protein
MFCFRGLFEYFTVEHRVETDQDEVACCGCDVKNASALPALSFSKPMVEAYYRHEVFNLNGGVRHCPIG